MNRCTTAAAKRSRQPHKTKQTKSKSFQEEARQEPKPSSGDCVNRLAQGRLSRVEPQGAKQMAAPAEPRTPNCTERTNRSSRVRMEAWPQWLLGWRPKNFVQQEPRRFYLTPTGLLMEGVYTQNPVNE